MGWFSTIVIGIPIQWWVATFSIIVVVGDLMLLLGIGVIHLLRHCHHWCSIKEWLATFSITIAISIPSPSQPAVGASLHWPYPCPCHPYPVVGCGLILPGVIASFPTQTVWSSLFVIGLLGGVGPVVGLSLGLLVIIRSLFSVTTSIAQLSWLSPVDQF